MGERLRKRCCAMMRPNVKTMRVNELVERFAAIGGERDEAQRLGDVQRYSRLCLQMKAVDDELNMSPARRDRILYWPTALAVACFVLFTWPDALGLGFPYLDSPFILLYWLIAAGAGVIACMAWVCERAWRRLLSTMILRLSVIAAGFNLQSVWRLKQYIDSHVMHPSYHSDASKASKD